MKHYKSIFLVLFGLAFFAIGSVPSRSKFLTLEHQTATLGNGLRIVLVKFPSPNVVAYQIPVHAGSRNEVEAGKTGFAHFFEHLMFRGTKNMTAKEFGQLYVKLGAENNAWTWFDMTNYHGVVAKQNLSQIMKAESDRFMNLHFDEKALRDEAGAVLGEYNKSVSSPDFIMEEKMLETAFKKHPYGHTTMGYKEDVLQYPERYEDVWPFFKRYYRPNHVSVVLVGDINFNEAKALIEAEFGPWKNPDDAPSNIPSEPEQTEPRYREIKLDKPTQTRIHIAQKVPAFTTKTKEFAALSILSEIYFSVTSDFQKEYRFKKKWLDSVRATPLETIDPFIWTVELRLSNEGEGKEKDLQEAVKNVFEEIQNHPPSAERVEATKSRFLNAALTSWFATPDELAGRIAWFTNFESDLEVLDRMFENLKAVTPEMISDFAKKYLTEKRQTTLVLRGSR